MQNRLNWTVVANAVRAGSDVRRPTRRTRSTAGLFALTLIAALASCDSEGVKGEGLGTTAESESPATGLGPSSGPGAEAEAPHGVGPSESGEGPSFSASTLPRAASVPECDAQWEGYAPVVCDWAHSVDAVVVGTIADVSAQLSPAVMSPNSPTNAGALVDTCEGYVFPALSITLAAPAWLYGDKSEVESITVSVGKWQLGNWVPAPAASKISSENPAGWSSETGGTAPFAVGDTLGVAMTWDTEHQRWSLMGEWPFTVDSDGTVLFSGEKQCIFNQPKFAAAPSYGELAEALAACSETAITEAGQTLRGARLNVWTQAPHFSYAAFCQYPDPASASACTADVQCAEGQECIGGACVLSGTQ